MIVALSAVACVMVVIGLGLVFQGAPFTRVEWGWTMVLSGTIAATGGVLLAGMVVLANALRRIERAVDQARAAPVPVAVPAEPARPAAPEDAGNRAILAAVDLVPNPPEAAAPAPPVAPPPDEAAAQVAVQATPKEPTVVGTYSSGGNAYVMYSDGSIKADTPRGRFIFDSIDELKAFVAQGGEDPDTSRRPAGTAA